MVIFKMKKRNEISSSYFLTIMLFIVLLFMSINSFPQNKTKKTYNLGVYKDLLEDINERDAKVALEVWIKLNAEEYNVEDVDVSIFEDTDAIISTAQKNEIDILYITGILYYLIKDKINLEPVLKTKVNNSDFFDLLLLSNKNIVSFNDFRGKKIIVRSGRYKLYCDLWLDLLCKQNNEPDKKKFFGEIKYTDKPMQAILPVMLGKYDVCIISSRAFEVMSEMNPQVANSLKVVDKIPNLINDIVCISKTLNKEERELILSITSNYRNLKKNDQVSTLFKSKTGGPLQEGDFNGIQNFIEKYKKHSPLRFIN